MGSESGGASARQRRHDHSQRHRRCRGRAMKPVATLKVWRGTTPEAGRFETYEVPFEPGQSVLDALRWIRAHRDPTLAIRFSCINANACKECMVEIDGDPHYACTARLEPREMTVKPLSNKALVR